MKTKLFLLLTIAVLTFASCDNEPKVEPLHVFTYDVSVRFLNTQTSESNDSVWSQKDVKFSIRTSDEAVIEYYSSLGKKFADYTYTYRRGDRLYPIEIENIDVNKQLPNPINVIYFNEITLNFVFKNESIE